MKDKKNDEGANKIMRVGLLFCAILVINPLDDTPAWKILVGFVAGAALLVVRENFIKK
jgi:hypothetical protein